MSDDLEFLRGLTDSPLKTSLSQVVPTDPLIYRFHKVIQIYGASMKALIQEKMGGDGIMSTFDFSLDIQKQEDVNGDRVVVIMIGKFLPYKQWERERVRHCYLLPTWYPGLSLSSIRRRIKLRGIIAYSIPNPEFDPLENDFN
jgi:hypothetical protein